MGYGDDLLITKLASKVKKQFPDRQIVIGEAGNRTSLLIYPFDTQSRDNKVVTLATGITEQVSITLRRYKELYIFDKSSAEHFLKKKIRKLLFLLRMLLHLADITLLLVPIISLLSPQQSQDR